MTKTPAEDETMYRIEVLDDRGNVFGVLIERGDDSTLAVSRHRSEPKLFETRQAAEQVKKAWLRNPFADHFGFEVVEVPPPKTPPACLADIVPDLMRVVRILESFRQAGADNISFSALMHDGDDTLGEAVKEAVRLYEQVPAAE